MKRWWTTQYKIILLQLSLFSGKSCSIINIINLTTHYGWQRNVWQRILIFPTITILTRVNWAYNFSFDTIVLIPQHTDISSICCRHFGTSYPIDLLRALRDQLSHWSVTGTSGPVQLLKMFCRRNKKKLFQISVKVRKKAGSGSVINKNGSKNW